MMIEPTGPAGYPANIVAALILASLAIFVCVNAEPRKPDIAIQAANDPAVRDATPCLILGGGDACFRDPRCDTLARYEAMSEGAKC